MADSIRIDARGLSCPQPAMLAREALLAQAGGRVEIVVDRGTARDNVTRVAERAAWRLAEERSLGDAVQLVFEK